MSRLLSHCRFERLLTVPLGSLSRLATLTRLTQKKVKFKWTEDFEKRFEEMTHCLVTALIHIVSSGSRGFVIYSDASRNGLGCVLMQQGRSLHMLQDN